MKTLLADLETNGLVLDSNLRMHCLVTKDYATKEVQRYGPTSLVKGILSLYHADRIVFHNFVGFDWRVLLYLYPKWTCKSYDDTLILSRLLFPYRKGKVHDIESYGEECGIPKPEHEDWSTFSEAMMHRCEQDVHILDHVYTKCMQQIDKYPEWREAAALEYEVARIHSHIQVPTGVTFDKEEAIKLRDNIDTSMHTLEDKMREVMPLRCNKGSTVNRIFKKDGSFYPYVESYFA